MLEKIDVLPVVTTELPQRYHSLEKNEEAKVINLHTKSSTFWYQLLNIWREQSLEESEQA